jgi:ferredoxin
MKVCPTSALQPAYLISGVEGMFSPHLVPRTGQCEFNCTLCGEVCPTGAIPKLTIDAKHKAVMGKARFDHALCLPWAKNEECICCEEHCPVGEKAIKFDIVKVKGTDGEEIELQRPYVIAEKCVGCGICENKCPVEGAAGIHVRRTEAVAVDREGKTVPVNALPIGG